MAIRCSNCGHELPREDARFCSYCGTYNTSQPQPQSQPAAPPAPGDSHSASPVAYPPSPVAIKPDAQPPDARATPWFGIDNQLPDAKVTPWFGIDDQQLDKQSFERSAQGYDRPQVQNPHPPSAHTRPPSAPPDEQPLPRPRSSDGGKRVVPETPRPAAGGPASDALSAPGRRPRMHKYTVARDVSHAADPVSDGGSVSSSDQKDAAALSWPDPVTHVTSDTGRPAPQKAPAIEDLPTTAWRKDAVESVDKQAPAIEDLPTRSWQIDQAAAQRKERVQATDIEDLPTSAMSAHRAGAEAADVEVVRGNATRAEDVRPPARSDVSATSESVRSRGQGPAPTSPKPLQPQPLPVGQGRHAFSDRVSAAAAPPSPFAQTSSAQPPFQSAAAGQSSYVAPLGQPPSTAVQPERNAIRPGRVYNVGRSRRMKMIAVLAALALLVLAVGIWIVVAQPFAVPESTAPLQTVSSTALGLTLRDPSGWQASSAGATWTLSDSSKTDQIIITQAAAPSTSDLTGVLNQRAKTLGMSSPKIGSAVTFAGSSWSQVQGDFQLQGASYHGTIYTTLHNGHLYTMTMLAPKSTFNDVERLIFTPVRSSLTFR